MVVLLVVEVNGSLFLRKDDAFVFGLDDERMCDVIQVLLC
jgi:hypothetical protein